MQDYQIVFVRLFRILEDYGNDFFVYDTMGFGNVVYNMDDLLLKIREYLENGCLMEEKYPKRVDNFFKYHDKENSKRVYEWILDN